MKNKLFSTIKSKSPKRNLFDLSHEKKLSTNFGFLVPHYFQEVIPSDSVKLSTEAIIRLHPLISPIYSRINVYMHYFYVPMYLLWSNFEDFITGGRDGLDQTPHPTVQVLDANKSFFAPGTLADYLGCATVKPSETVNDPIYYSSLPFRAYTLIYNEYYRDQNLITEIDINKHGNNNSTTDILELRRRAWPHDYFTSALPWSQKGGLVSMPNTVDYITGARATNPNNMLNTGQVQLVNPTAGSPNWAELADSTGLGFGIEAVEGINITINDFRKALRLQMWLERNARSGSRLAEMVLSHFSVKGDDLRYGRPKYIGGAKFPIAVSEVLSAYGDDTTMPLGEMGGHAIGVGSTPPLRYFCKDHGFIFGIMSVLPERSYQNGYDKTLIKNSKFDYPWPDFAHLGEQPILNGELYFDPTDATGNKGTFGYTPMYSHYKYSRNTIHGDFKETLSHWHTADIFETRPNLNPTFIEADTSAIDDRIFAVSDAQASHKLYVNLYNNVKAVRPLPTYGEPLL